jgi:iron complex transport system permease protein
LPIPSFSNKQGVKSARAVPFILLGLALPAVLILSVGVGAVAVPALSLLKAALHWFIPSVGLPPQKDVTILLFLRLPRILSALLVGSALGACGAVMQGLFRNPMASPEILGVSAGGSLGAVVAITTGLASSFLLALPLLTIVGALFSSVLIYALSSRRGATSLLFIVISGMAISSLFNGVTSSLLLFSRAQEVSQFIFWTMGGLDGRTWEHVTYSAPVLIPGIVVLSFFARDLNALSLGEQSAASLGMNVEGTKRIILALSAVVTGVAISVSGPVGFIGLLMPHLFRLIVGPDHRVLIPAAALGGGIFLVLCDLLGRAIAPPFEIRVGIITAIIGSPYLLSLIVRTQARRRTS